MPGDVVDAATRSRMMAGIRCKDTRPELVVRRGLHARGFRYRLHDRALPGKPDLVLPRWNAVIQVHGCFWHGHDCSLFRLPGTRRDFWKDKIETNRRRDRSTSEKLSQLGWRVAIVWECALKGTGRLGEEELVRTLTKWLRGCEAMLSIGGRRGSTLLSEGA